MRQLLWMVAFWLGLAGGTLAEPRLALVVGNSAYPAADARQGAAGDARLVARALTLAGFEVTVLQDADAAALGHALQRLEAGLRAAGPEATGLFYFEGKAVQSLGRTYLLPVDPGLTTASKLPLAAVDAQAVLRRLAGPPQRSVIMILDASRATGLAGVAGLSDGLAEMAVPVGAYLAYSTQPDTLAPPDAGTQRAGHGAFATALAQAIGAPGLPIEAVFAEVRVAVLQATGGQQNPWDTSNLTRSFTFMAQGHSDAAEQAWLGASLSGDPVQILQFLHAHPASAHETEARALLAEVMQAAVDGQGTKTAAPPAPTVTPHGAEPSGEVPAALKAAIAAASVTFRDPLTVGDPAILGQSIEALIATGPLFSPLEGLPAEAWEGQHCVACHKWTRAALCDQARFYVKEAAPSVADGQHPLGGAFKLVLKAWGQSDCP